MPARFPMCLYGEVDHGREHFSQSVQSGTSMVRPLGAASYRSGGCPHNPGRRHFLTANFRGDRASQVDRQDQVPNGLRGDGAITFGDLVGRVDYLEIACPKCARTGRGAAPCAPGSLTVREGMRC